MLETYLQAIKNLQTIDFQETLAIISANYDYSPTTFDNGLNPVVHNPAGTNEGSCRIFAFAQLQELTEEQTLNLFGHYYHVEVLAHPEGQNHANIRQFMRDGWAGIAFKGVALTPKAANVD
jgi:hypothetical protein